MNDLPNLNQHGYQVDTQLGCNREGGRITWKGKNLLTQETVVIKQFCFAVVGSSWSAYQAYEQEIKILQKLNHQGIPKYLDSIETKDGFCLIQEYIPAISLNKYRQLTVAEVQQITLKLLEILIYLQQQNPPILHRDLQPENILLDQELNVYLIDFGFASLGSKEVSGSSVFKGTPGFIAPEQIFKPTLASDLYSLGVTVVGLLSNKSITEIQNLASTDNPYQLNLKPLLPKLNRHFISWLEKMTNAKVSQRFSNAQTARDSLLSIVESTEAPSSNLILFDEVKSSNLATPQIVLATSTITALSSIAVWGINFVDRNLESSLAKIAIAILAGIVVGISELSAVQIATIDSFARVQGGILAIGVPIFLVATSGWIWGREEAVELTAMIVIAQLLILSYFWWQIPNLKSRSLKFRFSFLFAAIALGIILGLQLV
jgi:serine/threonine protein kinase